MPMLPSYQVSRDADRALEDFRMEFEGALAVAPADNWSTNFGLGVTGKFKKTFPIPVSAARFLAREGQDRYRSLYQRSLSMRPQDYFDGVEEFAAAIEAPDFIGWAGEPARIAAEMQRHADVITAAMLEANPNLDFYRSEEDGLASSTALFANAHPVNVFDTSLGTFDNDLANTGINAALIKDARQQFRTRKGANGQSMRLELTHMIVNPTREEEARDLLESDFLLTSLVQDGTAPSASTGATQNRFKGAVQLVVSHELTGASDDYAYMVASGGPWPWIVQVAEMPEYLTYDKDTDFYRDTGKVKQGVAFTAGVAAALPHSIIRYDLS
jgi:hypothetical protein